MKFWIGTVLLVQYGYVKPKAETVSHLEPKHFMDDLNKYVLSN